MHQLVFGDQALFLATPEHHPVRIGDLQVVNGLGDAFRSESVQSQNNIRSR